MKKSQKNQGLALGSSGTGTSVRAPRLANPKAPPTAGKMSSADDLSKRPSLSGLTKLTRADLAERAAILGLPVSAADRRIDLIERIRGSLSARETPPQPNPASGRLGERERPREEKSLQARGCAGSFPNTRSRSDGDKDSGGPVW